MKFQNDRGGRIVLQDIKRPAKDEWGTGLDAMQAAMELEKAVNKALLDLHKVADKHSDFMVSLASSQNLVKWYCYELVVVFYKASRKWYASSCLLHSLEWLLKCACTSGCLGLSQGSRTSSLAISNLMM